uniref:C2H2-type domain-containing protein n=1 Tax=Anopheles culicifacies TaxID=139723 RepID=A0A182M2U4_9DIPT
MYRKIIEFRVKITLVDALEFSVCGIGNCALQFKTKAALLDHLHVDHDMKTMESYEPIKCFHCTVPFGDVEDYANHIALHGYNRFVCMLCLCYHFLLSYVVDHMRESHGCTMGYTEEPIGDVQRSRGVGKRHWYWCV